jgi:energy-coupling factor transporter transmembrane protein EcfT
MSEDFSKIESLLSELKEYVNTRVAQAKLSVAEKLSNILAYVIILLLTALVFFLILVLLCASAAIAIGQWLNNLWLGFLIMAGICILFGFFMWVMKDAIFQRPIMNKFISVLFENESEDEKD